MSRYLLIPADETSADIKTVTVPEGLIFNELYINLRDKVINKSKLKMIADCLARNEISETEDGAILHRDKKVAEGFNLRDALIDTCNNTFLEKYEQFYKLLRMFDIIF